MMCYECARNVLERAAIGVCHHCSVGLCTEHACLVSDPVVVQRTVAMPVALPIQARLLLCGTCNAALTQPHLQKTA